MEAEVATAQALLEQDPSPAVMVLLVIEATRLHLRHGLPTDGRRLEAAARACLTFGYGGQARQLLALPQIERSLPETLLQQLTAAFRPSKS
jgi:hypothetical protein